ALPISASPVPPPCAQAAGSDVDPARIGAGLPFAEALADLRAAVEGRGVAVVQAPPGSGKTTLAPPLLADVVEGLVVVTGPRRVVVRSRSEERRVGQERTVRWPA